MALNGKGMVAIFGIMMFMFSVLIGLVVAPALREVITEMRGADNMNCGSSGLSTGQAVSCVFIDLLLALFIGTILFTGMGAITGTGGE